MSLEESIKNNLSSLRRKDLSLQLLIEKEKYDLTEKQNKPEKSEKSEKSEKPGNLLQNENAGTKMETESKMETETESKPEQSQTESKPEQSQTESKPEQSQTESKPETENENAETETEMEQSQTESKPETEGNMEQSQTESKPETENENAETDTEKPKKPRQRPSLMRQMSVRDIEMAPAYFQTAREMLAETNKVITTMPNAQPPIRLPTQPIPKEELLSSSGFMKTTGPPQKASTSQPPSTGLGDSLTASMACDSQVDDGDSQPTPSTSKGPVTSSKETTNPTSADDKGSMSVLEKALRESGIVFENMPSEPGKNKLPCNLYAKINTKSLPAWMIPPTEVGQGSTGLVLPTEPGLSTSRKKKKVVAKTAKNCLPFAIKSSPKPSPMELEEQAAFQDTDDEMGCSANPAKKQRRLDLETQ